MSYSLILRLEGLLLGCAGIAHLIYVSFFLDWSAFPLPLCMGGALFGLLYTTFGAVMLSGFTRLLLPTLIVNVMGLTGVLVSGATSPLAPIDPYLMIVDLISIPALLWLGVRRNSQTA